MSKLILLPPRLFAIQTVSRLHLIGQIKYDKVKVAKTQVDFFIRFTFNSIYPHIILNGGLFKQPTQNKIFWADLLRENNSVDYPYFTFYGVNPSLITKKFVNGKFQDSSLFKVELYSEFQTYSEKYKYHADSLNSDESLLPELQVRKSKFVDVNYLENLLQEQIKKEYK